MISGFYARRGGGAAAASPADAGQLRPDPAVGLSGAEGLRSEDREAGLTVVADCRLDDRAALAGALGLRDVESLSDSALILGAYARWGRDCPSHLFGDYAFAVWDARRRTLFCARDHVGARAFHYALTADRFVFGSAVGSVLAAPGVPDALDEEVVAGLLSPKVRMPVDRSCFRAVKRLSPGHMLAVEPESLRIERWWRPEAAPSVAPTSDDDRSQTFLALYRQAVGDCLRGAEAGSVGTHLSGGLDSSSITVLAAEELRRRGEPPPTAFAWQPAPPSGTAGEDDANADEYRLVEATASRAETPLVWCAPTGADVEAWLRQDGAREWGSDTLLHEMSVQRAAAARGVRRILSGWGGDECASYGGRGYYQELLLGGRFIRLWRALRARRSSAKNALSAVVLPLLPFGMELAIRRALDSERTAPPPQRSFAHPDLARRFKLRPPDLGTRGVRQRQCSLIGLGHLCERMEGWALEGSRRGIEYGYPLLDRRLMEFVLGLPPEQFHQGRWSRWVMRHALRTVLPPEVCWYTDKRDPVRFAGYRGSVIETLPVLHRELAGRAAAPSRARYVDMPHLLTCLEDGWPAGEPFAHRALTAVRFLDF